MSLIKQIFDDVTSDKASPPVTTKFTITGSITTSLSFEKKVLGSFLNLVSVFSGDQIIKLMTF